MAVVLILHSPSCIALVLDVLGVTIHHHMPVPVTRFSFPSESLLGRYDVIPLSSLSSIHAHYGLHGHGTPQLQPGLIKVVPQRCGGAYVEGTSGFNRSFSSLSKADLKAEVYLDSVPAL